jgi:hypothetical protein
MYVYLDVIDTCDALISPAEDGNLIAETCVGVTDIIC